MNIFLIFLNQLQNVYERESVLFDWIGKLTAGISVGYTKADGTSAVYLNKNAVVPDKGCECLTQRNG